jgi:carotenoid cleavage dioxygenase-like enzyme
MSFRFPETPTYTGFNAPSRVEAEIFDLEVEGEVPAALHGTFYRVGPDFHYPPLLGDDININGDGMVTAFRFSGGHVDFQSRYVRTEKFKLEAAARRALFGAYRNPFTDDPAVRGRDRTLANTNIVAHAGHLLALKEDGLPYALDPATLATLGRHDFAGRMTSETTTAHPKIDPGSGEMIAFGYEARGLATRDIALQTVDAAGHLTREEFFDAPYCSFIHDWAVSAGHIVFPLMPTTADTARMRAGGPHWVFDTTLDTMIGILRRDAPAKDIRWFRAPGFGIGHFLNAFSDGDKVRVDGFMSARNQFPFVPNSDGSPFDRQASVPRLTRWTFDLAKPGDRFEAETLYPDFMEMPRLDERYAMRPHRIGFAAVIDQERPLNVAGTIGLGWNTIVRVDLATRRQARYYVGERTTCQEPCFVPRSPGAPEGDGYVLTMLTRMRDAIESELLILDAARLSDGPVAAIKLPIRLRGAIHGNWVPAGTSSIPSEPARSS